MVFEWFELFPKLRGWTLWSWSPLKFTYPLDFLLYGEKKLVVTKGEDVCPLSNFKFEELRS